MYIDDYNKSDNDNSTEKNDKGEDAENYLGEDIENGNRNDN